MSGPLNKLQNLFGTIAGRRGSISPKENSARENHARRLLHPAGLSTIQITGSRVRVVVFKDDRGVKQPLFDSQINCETEGEEQATKSLCDMRSVEHLEQSTSSTGSVPSLGNSAGWVGSTAKNRRAGFVKRPSTDSELLGEMMFGSMPMKTIGNSVKVHYIRSTDQLMLTKTFSPGRKLLHQCSLTDYSDTCPLPGDVSSQTIERSFAPVPKNHSMLNNLHCSLSPDSGRNLRSSSLSVPILRPSSALSAHSSSLTHSPPSPVHVNSLTVSGSVRSSLTRRMQRYRATSLENPSELYRKVLKPLDKPQQSNSKRKYGIGVILSLSELSEPDIQHFQSFLFSHFTLIDAHLEKFREFVLDAAHQTKGQAFIAAMTQAYNDFLKDFLSLYKAPRIEAPVWLSLVGQVDKRQQVCGQFMEVFGACIAEMETRDKKYFLSTLLTAVLSHHLAWVFSVSRQTTDSRFNKMIPKSLGVLAESHPYNPLWAQLGDLFGAVSYPLKLSRTIVTGKNYTTVCRLLYILTYFIRCSEVEPWKPPESTPKVSIHKLKSSKIPVPRPNGSHHSSHDHEYKSHDSSHDHECKSHDSSHDLSQLEVQDLMSKLEDDLTFESRASSSVTVISDHDPHSLQTPFASPINLGRDTPVIKPHPFSIRQTTRQHSFSSDVETSSIGSRSYSGAAMCARSPSTGLRSPKKTASVSSRSSDRSESRHSSFKQHTPSHVTRQLSPIATAGHSTYNEPTTTPSPCDHGDGISCAYLSTCESMGFCPLPGREDGFKTFNPAALRLPLNKLGVLGGGGFEHKMCKHNSTTSMDSGYDRSLTASTTTDRDSCYTSGFSDLSKDSYTTSTCSDCIYMNTDSWDQLGKNTSHYHCDPEETLCNLQDTTPEQSLSSLRPRSGAISFATKSVASSSRYRMNNSCESQDTTSNLQDTKNSISPDLPSPTQALLPTKVTTLVENGEDYKTVMRKRGKYVAGARPPSLDGLSPTKRVPLVQVQQPTLVKDDSHENTEHCHETTKHHCDTTQDSRTNSPGRSLVRQAALPSESDSIPEYSGDTTEYPVNTTGILSDTRPFSPSQSLPLSSVPFMLARQRSSSDALPGNSQGMFNPDIGSSALPTDSLSMLSTDSGRGTKSCVTGNYSQDLETLSQSGLSEDLYDSDDAFYCINGKCFEKKDSLGEDRFDVEKSFSANTLRMSRQNPSLLQQKLEAYDSAVSGLGQPETPEQFADFEDVALPAVDDFHLDLPHEGFHDDHFSQRQNLSDFGHSLFVGHSPHYLPDFVLHGTSQPADQQFQDKLVKDLTSSVKHSIIDEPIEHSVAIVADTDNWTVKIVSTSRSLQTSDVICGSTHMQPSRYIKQLLGTVRNMNDMRLPPDFCLSHVEDRLLELNERSITLANTLLEYGSDTDFGDILPKTLETMGIQDHFDRLLLVVLAGVNCPDQDIKARLDYIFMTNLLGKQYF